VAPPDLDQGDTPPQLHGWRPVVRQRLPFTATLVYSENDPFCTPQASLALADDWGARAHPIGLRGHVNGESELANWPEGRCLLEALARARSQAV
jgi:predicted alpha/beta hydrolase family esterase